MCNTPHSHTGHTHGNTGKMLTRHDFFTRVTWLIHMCAVTHSHMWHDLFICVPWLIEMWDMTHSHVRLDSLIRKKYTRQWSETHANHLVMGIHTCDMTGITHSHLWHDFIHTQEAHKAIQAKHTPTILLWEYICATWLIWLIHMYDRTPSYTGSTWGNMNESWHTHQWVLSHTSMSLVTHINESCDYECLHTQEAHEAIQAKHTPNILLWEYIWMCYVTDMNESCHTHIYMCHSQKAHTTIRMKHVWDMTHPHLWQDSLMCVPWLIHRQEEHTARKATHTPHILLWQYIRVTRLIDMCHITRYHSFIPPDKLRVGGGSTLYTLFCLICTINSELTYLTICTTKKWAGLDIHWFLGDGFDTLWIPRRFSCGTESTHGNKGEAHTNHPFTRIHMCDMTHIHVWHDAFVHRKHTRQ